MRSIPFTFLLLLFAIVSVGLAGIRIADGSLSRVFGAPPTPIGETLYDFDPRDVKHIYIAGNGVSAHCVHGETGWRVVHPSEDRMDSRIAQALIAFTLGSKVEGAIPAEKVESKNLGFEDGRVVLRIADANDEPLAKFMIGHRTAWIGTDPETGTEIPTVFVQPRDKNRKDYLYACTDPQDIHAALSDGLKRLRDHHPFLFHPNILESLRIKNRTGELLLSRESTSLPWKIVKPLEVKSDKTTLVALLQGLYDLQAVNVMSRSEVTLPANETTSVDQIAMRFYGQEEETILNIYPPVSPEATTVLATISDRPETVFELTLKSLPASLSRGRLVGLNELPLSVNALRDPTLSDLNVSQVRGIFISSALGDEILVMRDAPKDLFQVMIEGKLQAPDDRALFSLLTTITEAKVADFVTDSATDLAPYGLDRPFLSIRFLSFDDTTVQFDFGEAKDGSINAIRNGTTTVVKIDPTMLDFISVNSWEWRDTILWTLSEPDVVGIRRRIKDQPPIDLGYAFLTESWNAKESGEDRSSELSVDRANIMLSKLLEPRASNWLRPGHSAALAALASPDLVFDVLTKTFDDQGEFSGVSSRQLEISTVGLGEGLISYGRITGEPNPFLLDSELVKRLAVDLFSFD